VCRVVPKQLEPIGRRARHDLDPCVALDRQRQVFERTVNPNGDRVALEARADAARDGSAVDG
jgi:hypothetical protein